MSNPCDYANGKTLLDLIIEEPIWWTCVYKFGVKFNIFPSQNRDDIFDQTNSTEMSSVQFCPVNGWHYGRVMGYKTYDEAKNGSYYDEVGENGRVQ